jgi:hypothetical protein
MTYFESNFLQYGRIVEDGDGNGDGNGMREYGNGGGRIWEWK